MKMYLFGLRVGLGEYRSLIDFTVAASLIRREVMIALFSLPYPTELLVRLACVP